MNQTDTPEQWREPFPESEIPFILAAVLRCSAGLKKKDECEHENHLTLQLARLLLLDPEMLKRHVHLDWEVWEFEGRKAELLGRLDLRYLYSTGTSHPWPCFTIEAKRLHVKFSKGGWKSLVSEYVTGETGKPVHEEQGMMCFVTGRYSGGLKSAGMVGYVYDGDVTRALDGIEKAIKNHAEKLKLSKTQKMGVSKIIQGESRIMESMHDLTNGVFTIFHILFSV